MAEIKFPTEEVSLPSRGKLYPEDSPLRSGIVTIKYPTSKSEDILTNQDYIQKGTVVDKFLQDLIVDKNINYGEILTGDKNALLVAARILGYGKSYTFEYAGREEEVDLTQIEDKPLHPAVQEASENRFAFQLPLSNRVIEFKILNGNDEAAIERELKGLKKINKNNSPEISTRLKHMILSVDGDDKVENIRSFVDNEMLAADSRAFRKYASEIQPDVDMVFYPEDSDKAVQIPITVTFLWPDINV